MRLPTGVTATLRDNINQQYIAHRAFRKKLSKLYAESMYFFPLREEERDYLKKLTSQLGSILDEFDYVFNQKRILEQSKGQQSLWL